jgi:hypothetical protein
MASMHRTSPPADIMIGRSAATIHPGDQPTLQHHHTTSTTPIGH